MKQDCYISRIVSPIIISLNEECFSCYLGFVEQVFHFNNKSSIRLNLN